MAGEIITKSTISNYYTITSIIANGNVQEYVYGKASYGYSKYGSIGSLGINITKSTISNYYSIESILQGS